MQRTLAGNRRMVRTVLAALYRRLTLIFRFDPRQNRLLVRCDTRSHELNIFHGSSTEQPCLSVSPFTRASGLHFFAAQRLDRIPEEGGASCLSFGGCVAINVRCS